MANRSVRWNKRAADQFRAAVEYIAADSVTQAEKVRLEILHATEKLSEHPDFYPPDKWKTTNPGNFRAFELHSLRISYFASDTEVRILRVRHTSREPKKY